MQLTKTQRETLNIVRINYRDILLGFGICPKCCNRQLEKGFRMCARCRELDRERKVGLRK